MYKNFIVLFITLGFSTCCPAQNTNESLFTIADGYNAVSVIYDNKGTSLDSVSAFLLADDIEKVTGLKPIVKPFGKFIDTDAILIGNINSNFIKSFITNAIPQSFFNQKESFYNGIAIAKNGVKHYIIAGTDARGTAFGVFKVSKHIGVNPWYWWADVPVKKQKLLKITSQSYFSEQPTVEYRGIFLNDEDWGLQPWAAKTFEKDPADIGPKTYAKIFELLLRLNANTIWPAMHPSTKAFFYYPGNVAMAQKYNIVIGTSHAEPMLRNNVDEWKPEFGKFDYKNNKAKVASYWEQRVKEAKNTDAIYTMGIRGVHDSGMEGVSGIEEASQLLGQVITDQRDMLQRNLSKPPNKIPQVFTVYKEVLDLYEHGMNIPNDITLVWTDDNYGYIRQLSNDREQLRDGGAGVYYHISYWGRPHDNLWLNTTPPGLIQEEMLKAYYKNANKIWIVNVGDIKPGEYATQLFLDMAYNIKPFLNQDYLNEHSINFYSIIFGQQLGKSISGIKQEYYNLAFERKPEYMGWSQTEPTTKVGKTAYNPFMYGDEIDKRLKEYTNLGKQSDSIYNNVPGKLKDAYFELVQYPVKAAMFMNYKHLYRDLAIKYNEDKRLVAQHYKDASLAAYDSISTLTDFYNTKIANGKWSNMMSMKPRNLPVFDKPDILLTNYTTNDVAGFKIEGNDTITYTLPKFYQGFKDSYFIDVFMQKQGTVSWSLKGFPKWLVASKTSGTLNANNTMQERIVLTVDWNMYNSTKPVTKNISLKLGNKKYNIKVNTAVHPKGLKNEKYFIEKNGYAVAYAKSYNKKQDAAKASWQAFDNLGYSGALMQAQPLNAVQLDTVNIKANPKLSYTFYTETITNKAEILVYALPTHPLTGKHNVKIGVQWDDEPLQILNFQTYDRSSTWKQNVLSNVAKVSVPVNLKTDGKHMLNIFMIDQGVGLDFIYLKTTSSALPYGLLPETGTF